MSDPSGEPFDWLADPQTRHGGLEMIRAAVRRGWLEGSAPELVTRRRRLIEALMTLLNDPATEATDRERIQACRVMLLDMTEANIRLTFGGELARRPRRRIIRGRGVEPARRPRA
jgi:hypothetical protein